METAFLKGLICFDRLTALYNKAVMNSCFKTIEVKVH